MMVITYTRRRVTRQRRGVENCSAPSFRTPQSTESVPCRHDLILSLVLNFRVYIRSDDVILSLVLNFRMYIRSDDVILSLVLNFRIYIANYNVILSLVFNLYSIYRKLQCYIITFIKF